MVLTSPHLLTPPLTRGDDAARAGDDVVDDHVELVEGAHEVVLVALLRQWRHQPQLVNVQLRPDADAEDGDAVASRRLRVRHRPLALDARLAVRQHDRHVGRVGPLAVTGPEHDAVHEGQARLRVRVAVQVLDGEYGGDQRGARRVRAQQELHVGRAAEPDDAHLCTAAIAPGYYFIRFKDHKLQQLALTIRIGIFVFEEN